jgi:hypothetical protein
VSACHPVRFSPWSRAAATETDTQTPPPSMMPADIAQGIAKDAQENLDGLDVVNVPTYGGSAPWYVGQTTEGLLEGVIRYQISI